MSKYYYTIYGLNIESEVELSELIKKDNRMPNIDVSIYMGEELEDLIGKRWKYKNKQDISVSVNNIAKYTMINGNRININPCKGANISDIKSFLYGWIFSIISIQRGNIPLHGTSVVNNDECLIITGDSKSGKSTLASALINQKYKFLTDDISVIDFGLNNKISVNPGFPYQKIRKDILDKLDYKIEDVTESKGNRLDISMNDHFINEKMNLKAIIEINVGDTDNVEIKEVFGNDKLRTILDNIFFGKIEKAFGMEQKYFEKCMNISKSIPVYRIIRPKEKFTVNEQIDLLKKVVV